MPGRVDDDVGALFGLEEDLRGVDGDALVALGLDGVHQEGPFERHAAPFGHRLDRLELAVGQRARVVDQPADQGRLAVVDMADDDDLHGVGFTLHRRARSDGEKRRGGATRAGCSQAVSGAGVHERPAPGETRSPEIPGIVPLGRAHARDGGLVVLAGWSGGFGGPGEAPRDAVSFRAGRSVGRRGGGGCSGHHR